MGLGDYVMKIRIAKIRTMGIDVIRTYCQSLKIILIALALLCVFTPRVFAVTYTLYTEALPPYSFASGPKKGAAVDIASTLFERTGIPFEVKITPWKRAYVTVSNTASTCFFPVQRNQEREVFFRWVSPLYISQTAFYGLKGDDIKVRTLQDAKSLRIGSYNGSAAAEYLDSIGYDIKTVANDKQNIKKLNSKRIDLWAGDPLSVRYFSGLEGVELDEKLVYFTTLRALACSLQTPDDIVEKLQQELNAMYADGTIEKILKNYR